MNTVHEGSPKLKVKVIPCHIAEDMNTPIKAMPSGNFFLKGVRIVILILLIMKYAMATPQYWCLKMAI